MPLSPYFSTAPDQVIQWVCDARQCTFELVADLSDAQLMGPMLPTINPLLWEIGHHAWFQSRWALRHAGGTPVRDNEDALYDSIAIAHDIRWDLPLPSRADTLEYLRTVRDRTVGRLEHSPSAADIYHAVYATLHEDMHTEAITYTRQTLGYAAPQLSIAPQKHSDSAAAGGGPLLGDAHIPGGTFMLGSTAEEPFPFDNEKWAHPVTIQPFAIGRAPVTQAEFLAFVEDGGYQNRSHWDEDGWEWRTQTESKHPVYWRRGDGWQRRHFDRWVPLEQHLPVIHVNWHETQAYCRWAGRRLPSEAEWQAAAAAEPDAAGGLAQRQRRFPWGDEAPSPERANLDWRLMGCLEVGALPQGDSAFGCRQMVGNLWEWTDSVFRPFPGFEPDPYKEYSQPWFETRKVMLGGCWATRSRLIRNNYRNFQTPDRRDIWVGFRTCAL